MEVRTLNEPINIMGVVAYPNPSSIRNIRFIDSRYNTKFIIPDGGSILVRSVDGDASILPCTYIDDYHARIGNGVYHICEFAEIMEANGSTCRPWQPVVIQGYYQSP